MMQYYEVKRKTENKEEKQRFAENELQKQEEVHIVRRDFKLPTRVTEKHPII